MKTIDAPDARSGQSLRIDRLLWMLRFAKSRSAAQAIVAAGHVRRNGVRVIRLSQPVCAGDVLTVPIGGAIRVVEIATLPARRGPPAEAAAHYREIASNSQQETIAFPVLDERRCRP